MLPYEKHPAVLACQATLTAAVERREKLRDELDAMPLHDAMSEGGARERAALKADFERTFEAELLAREQLHGALQAAIDELFPDLVAAQEMQAEAEAEHASLRGELEEASACGDSAERIATFTKAIADKEVVINRARRDVRRLVKKHGLG